ncbi:MAG: hypothetical protein HPY45_12375 [Anaerolineae bacterium]|nr:hypothetical protein [Anaerolineae bacterium]
METTGFSVRLDSKQEANLAFNFEQDSDLWPVLLSNHFCSHGTLLEELKRGILEDTQEWQKLVSETKKKGFADIKTIALEKSVQWNMRFRQLLQDPVHVQILKVYLRSVIALKMKRIADFGARAQTKQKINNILSFVGNEAYAYLDRYADITNCLCTGKTPSGGNMTPALRVFYESRQAEQAKKVAAMVAIIIVFKGANSLEDTRKLQNFIDYNLIAPLEALANSEDKNEAKQNKEKLEAYRKLRAAVEITFE